MFIRSLEKAGLLQSGGGGGGGGVEGGKLHRRSCNIKE